MLAKSAAAFVSESLDAWSVWWCAVYGRPTGLSNDFSQIICALR